jgi:hypothetical protein
MPCLLERRDEPRGERHVAKPPALSTTLLDPQRL